MTANCLAPAPATFGRRMFELLARRGMLLTMVDRAQVATSMFLRSPHSAPG